MSIHSHQSVIVHLLFVSNDQIGMKNNGTMISYLFLNDNGQCIQLNSSQRSFHLHPTLKIFSLASTQVEDLKNLMHSLHPHSTFFLCFASVSVISVGSCSRSFFSGWEDMHFREW